MIGIYKITNLLNGRFYIGSSNDIQRRWLEHKAPKSNRYRIDKDIKTYGVDNFKLETIQECCIQDLRRIEMETIIALKPYYNDAVRGWAFSKDICKKISNQTKNWWNNLPDETKERIIKNNLSHKGWENNTVPQWVREKISKTLMGKYTKPVLIVELNKKFKSINDCAKFLHTDCAYISNHLHGKYKTIKGYHIVYCQEELWNSIV